MKKIGRPTAYRKTFPQKAERLWSEGATDAEVADALKIPVRSLYDYLQKYPEFLQAQKTGKAVADELVEQALFKRATGYQHPDTHFSTFEGIVIETPTVKHYAPDTTACIFWLKNRKRGEWRDRTETELSGTVSGLPEDLVKAIQARAAEKAREKAKG